MSNSKRSILALAIAGVIYGVPGIGLAENGLEEIVVTARKRSENLQDVPIAITAFTEATIKNAGIERPGDFISMMPNVTLVNTANVGDTQVAFAVSSPRGMPNPRSPMWSMVCSAPTPTVSWKKCSMCSR